MPSVVPVTTEQRILEAAAVLPPHGAVTGWAALHWLGARRWFSGLAADATTEHSIWLAIAGEHVRRQSGIAVCAERLDPSDVIVVDGVRITSPVRSVCFEMRYASTVSRAVQVLAMACYSDTVSIAEVAAHAEAHSGWTGIPQCRAALPLADENCWSPTEADMLYTWRVLADLPRPLCNRPVFDRSGRHIGTPDLLDVEAGVFGEYEGVVHLDRARRSSDVRREEAFRRVGLEGFTLLAPDRSEPAVMVDRMLAARARAKWEAEAVRAWTVETPSWWTPTHTVDLRRDLSPAQRGRFLRYRRE